MKLLTFIFSIYILGTQIVLSQDSTRLSDLKSFTDSTGAVHLFFRIYEDHEKSDYVYFHIYHYNTEKQELEVFLDHFYERNNRSESSVEIYDYQFISNHPETLIYSGSNQDRGSFYIKRENDIAFQYAIGKGGFIRPKLLTTNADSSVVYASLIKRWVKSEDGGRSWPDPIDITEGTLSEELTLDFEPISISPYDKSLMFGIDSGLVRSVDGGATTEKYNHQLSPARLEMHYDADKNHIYMINDTRIERPCELRNCVAFYSNNSRGEPGQWVRKNVFTGFKNISANATKKGRLFSWDADSIHVSKDYGKSFSFFYLYERDEILDLRAEGENIFFLTRKTLYQIANGTVSPIVELPVRIEDLR